MTEEEARIKGHEPSPQQRPGPARATCPCGYFELVEPEWKPYLSSNGWVLAWYYGVKCPDHGWASRMKRIKARPIFTFDSDPGEDILA